MSRRKKTVTVSLVNLVETWSSLNRQGHSPYTQGRTRWGSTDFTGPRVLVKLSVGRVFLTSGTHSEPWSDQNLYHLNPTYTGSYDGRYYPFFHECSGERTKVPHVESPPEENTPFSSLFLCLLKQNVELKVKSVSF